MTTPDWRTSSRCGQGNCVEVAKVPDGVALRDNKDPDGPILALTRTAWIALRASILTP